MKSIWIVLLLAIGCAHAQIQVSENHRFLQTVDGKPFFWLGDTDWELFHRLTREEAERVIKTRSEQGFNVLQIVALAEENGVRQPNRYGDYPLNNEDPTQLLVTPGNDPANDYEYDYWDHVDYVIQKAASYDMYVGLLPTWGDKVAHAWGVGPRIFNVENARAYGESLARRYKDQWNIIWILGGDRPAVYDRTTEGRKEHFDDRPIWRSMADGIRAVSGTAAFITYHPAGGENRTSKYWQDETWLDMHAFQSGHGSREVDPWRWVREDLALSPPRPTLDMEPCYEDHPVNPWDGKWTRASRGYFTAYDVRARIYRTIFAGGCGVTYGHHQIWQFLDTARYKPINIGDTLIGWRSALTAVAATQMKFLKNLMLSRPYFGRISDPSLIKSEPGRTYVDWIAATRDQAGSYAFVYLPQNKSVTVDLSKLSGNLMQPRWYDVRTGKAIKAQQIKGRRVATLTPPSSERDWVLVIDDATHNFPPPGVVP